MLFQCTMKLRRVQTLFKIQNPYKNKTYYIVSSNFDFFLEIVETYYIIYIIIKRMIIAGVKLKSFILCNNKIRLDKVKSS